MTIAKKLITNERPQFSIHTISLTTEETLLLRRLSQGASDFIGRSISGSAIVRALIRQIVKQGPSAEDALFVEVEKELKAGIRWGSKQK